MSMKLLRRWGVLLLVVGLLAGACGKDDNDKKSDDGTTQTNDSTEGSAAGSDSSGGDHAGALEGMKGTTPLTNLSDDFKDRLKAVNPDLQDFNYAGESYDAAIIIGLAVESAQTDGIDYANKIQEVTRNGEKCTTFADCKQMIADGKDIDYDGVTGALTFSGNGEPTQASYGILQFGADDRLDDSLTKFVDATAPASADVALEPAEGTRAGDGELKIGTLLPETGSLAFLGPPEFAGVDLAIKEMNEAGGVLGKNVVVSHGDSGDTSTDTANLTVDRLLSENVDAIIGAASSSVSLTVVDKIAGAGVVQFSPANTSKKFTTYADKGLYFRTAPSDVLQGAILGQTIAGDGHTTVGILALDDDYGTGLLEDLKNALSEANVEVVYEKVYDPKAQTFDAEVGELKGADPEAIVVIGFDESSRILTTMVEQGIGPKDKAVYGCDGNMGNALGENFDAGK